MLSGLIGIIVWVLQILNFVVLVYCVLTFVIPQNDLVRKLGGYVEPILNPFRNLLYRFFPKLRNLPMDFSPLVLWLAIQIGVWILNILR
ncbi:MAG: YggT family protein [Clostridia bacterium]